MCISIFNRCLPLHTSAHTYVLKPGNPPPPPLFLGGGLQQHRSASSTCDIDRQPLLATVTKDSVEFVFNEALLCIHSIIRAIWLSSLNMPLHFARKFGRVSKGRQLAL